MSEQQSDQPKSVEISGQLAEMLKRYAEAENISIDTAARQFIRDGLEGA